jgi:hypothetical protein
MGIGGRELERTMRRWVVSVFLLSLLVFGFVHPVWSSTLSHYLSVPFHYQETSYYCGPASLEMIFDYYGTDILQIEIADVASTSEESGGTGLWEMIRAAHFSNLSLSVVNELPWSIRGYSARSLGYAAFERFDLSLENLKSLLASGYPIVVATLYSRQWTNGHFRVVVGYNETHVTLHDPWFNSPYEGPNVNMSNSEFLYLWAPCDNWGLFVSPWNVSISAPSSVKANEVFNVTVTTTYTCPDQFVTDDYTASSVNTTIMLPERLELLQGEVSRKPMDLSQLYAGKSVKMNWAVRAKEPGNCTITAESEGVVSSSMPYRYTDRIGGSGNMTIHVQTASSTIPGDINHDGVVSILDIVAMASIYGCEASDASFDQDADLAQPYGVINLLDIVSCAYYYGQRYT